ncbi:MAG: aldo/keto reductase [Trueperaceae bacterium]|nr:aldo/keto reductase [Trueperaceae bacterium]MCO5173520.1 aldo/keto reductase [Trueperaceae bacterium]MCW5818508.1 aldo/keto reductase [Trueperaceae bacterium]
MNPPGTRVTGTQRWEQHLTPELFDLIEELVAFSAERGKELVDLAFAWLLADQNVASVIAGATSAAQVERNARTAAWRLSGTEREAVDALLSAHGFTP